MSEATKKFWSMLDQADPRIQTCWDQKDEKLKRDRLEEFLKEASTGERYMALFFRDVWQGGPGRGNSHSSSPKRCVSSIGRRP